MNNNQLNRALKILRKTGDKFLVMDKDSDEVFALMSLDQYENLILDDENFFDYDNYDPTNLYTPNDEEFLNDDINNEDDSFNPEDLNNINFDEEKKIGEDLEKDDNKLNDTKEEEITTTPIKNTGNWHSVGNIITEESLDDVQEDSEEEEDDKFYLEPVE